MDRFTYLTSLRKTVIAEISGVQDAESFLAWDDTRPNHLTKINLARIFDEARKGASTLGCSSCIATPVVVRSDM